jgi:hypothetical protein
MCGAAYGSSVVDVRRGFEDCGLMLWRRARASRLNYAEGSEGSQDGVVLASSRGCWGWSAYSTKVLRTER